MNGNDEGSTAIERGLASLRATEWQGSPPERGAVMRAATRRERRHRARRVGVACGVLLLLGGASYAGYRAVSRSWEASIRAEGDHVEVVLDGVKVEPENIQWLPDGTCLVTINGAKVLLDPKQPGGASASIRVEQADEEE